MVERGETVGLTLMVVKMMKMVKMKLAGHFCFETVLMNERHSLAKYISEICLASMRGFVCLCEGNSRLLADNNNLRPLYRQPTPRK